MLAAPDSPSAGRLGRLLDHLATEHSAARLPDWWYQINGAVNLIGVYKDQNQDGARPVGMGDNFIRAISTHRVRLVAERAGIELFPAQTSVGVKGGIGIAVTGMREWAELHPDHHGIHHDVKNAHSATSRAAMLESLAASEEPEIAALVQVAWAEYRAERTVLHNGRPLPGVSSTEGLVQGDPYANLFFAYAIRRAQTAALEGLHSVNGAGAYSGGTAVWIADDAYFLGPPNLVYDVVEKYEKDLQEQLGLASSRDKYEVFVQDGHDSLLRPNQFSITGVDVNGVIHSGMLVGGCPVGSAEYVQHHISQRFETIVSEATSLKNQLQSNDPMALWTLTQRCIQHQSAHWMQHCYPSDVKAGLELVQEQLDALASASWGSTEILDDDIGRQRVRLAVRDGGAGLRDLVDVQPAAFVGACWQTLPQLVNHEGSDGTTAAGFFPHLVNLFGVGAFDADRLGAGRFTGLCGGSSRLGAEYKAAYLAMQGEMAAADRAEGPLAANVQDSGYGFSAHGQRLLTRQREGPRVKRLEADVAALPKTDMRRVAYLSTAKSETCHLLMTAYPDRDFNFRPDEWYELLHRYFGMPSRLLKQFVGSPIAGSNPRRYCDAHGFELFGGGIGMFPGGATMKRHDHVKWGLLEALKALGVGVQCEVTYLFARHVSPAARDHLEGRGRQGTVPDFVITTEQVDMLYDLKGIGMARSRYIRCQPAALDKGFACERRAALVPNQYATAARNVDTRFNGTAANAKGPMEKALEDMGGVKPLVFGHYGEICKSFDRLLRTASRVGAQRLQGALYVKTPEQAAAVLLWQLRRKVASAVLRANVNCLQDLMPNLFRYGPSSQRNREEAQRRFFSRGDASSTSYQYDRSHSNFPRDRWGTRF